MTKRYVGMAIFLFAFAAVFVIFALVAWGLSKGDLGAFIEFTIPRRRRRYGEPAVVSYPAYVSINAGLGYAAAICMSAIAHLRTSPALHVVAMCSGILVALWAAVDGMALGVDLNSKLYAVLFAMVAIALSIYSSVKMIRDRAPVAPNTLPPQSTWT